MGFAKIPGLTAEALLDRTIDLRAQNQRHNSVPSSRVAGWFWGGGGGRWRGDVVGGEREDVDVLKVFQETMEVGEILAAAGKVGALGED